MAIQFNCPYCTASIRVPDSAAGKRGTCPKCATKIIVPQVQPPPGSAEPATKIPIVSKTAPPVPPHPPAGLPQTGSPIVAESPSIAQVVRRRGKRKRPNLIIPIAMFGVVVAALAYWMWKPSAKLEGEIAAERLPDFAVPPALVEKSSFPLPAEEIEPIWETLRKHPPAGVRVPDRFEMQFLPESEGLQVLVRKTAATEVFRVQTSRAPAIRQFLKPHFEEILKEQQTEFREALKRFLQDWQTARESDLPFKTDAYFKPLGFNRLTGTAGYCLVAQVGSQTYRCIHEDAAGDLYFLLPKQAEEFALIGRKLPSGKTIFPGRYTVSVGNSAPEPVAKSPESGETKPPEETPMEPAETDSDKAAKTEMRGE